MAKIESSIGTKMVSQKPLKEFVVGSLDSDISNFEQPKSFDPNKYSKVSSSDAMDKLNKNKAEKEQREKELSREDDSFRRNRLETFLGIRDEEKTILIDDTPVVIRTLLGYELRELNEVVQNIMVDNESNSGNKTLDIWVQIAARVIKSIDGELLTDLVLSKKVNDKVKFLYDANQLFLEAIYENYMVFKKEVAERYNKPLIESLKVAEELANDLKKA